MPILSPERWRDIQALFSQALDVAPAARTSILDVSCSGDPALRAEVERLLAAHDASGGFLESLDPMKAGALLTEAPIDSSPEAPVPSSIGPYRIVRRLGGGGMGIVYLAHDPRLERPVAVKLLRPSVLLGGASRHRLREEALAASALDHPNIAPIYEIGETPDGRLFIAMAYCEGEPLAHRIARGPLPPREAVGLARQVADALASAHRRGIVHRDVKPGNIIVSPEGRARLLDFGVASIAGRERTPGGAAAGTPAYMSPEQTRAEIPHPTSDVWSLGVVLYEMLAGERPFRAEGEEALRDAIRDDEPRPLRALRPDVPDGAARMVERCLAKDPADRYANGGALLADLAAFEAPSTALAARAGERAVVRHGLVAALFVLLLVVGLSLWPRLRATDTPPDPTADAVTLAADRLAVLPLADYSPDPEDAYLAEGLTEELISRLSRLPDLRVIARTSVMPYRDSEKSIAEIATELGVGTVLEGSVRKAGDRVRITVQLVDARSQEHLWSADYDAELADVLAVQSEVAAQVARALNVELGADERRQLAQQGTENPEAHELYLRGRYFWNKRNTENFQKALDYFRQAIDQDPLYAAAWAGLADTYEMLAEDGLPPEQGWALARAAADRALAIDSGLAEAHSALATVSMSTLELERADRHFRLAIAANPSYALAHQRYSTLLSGTGRLEEGVRSAATAQELNPLSTYARAGLGYALYLARRYDEALAQLRTTREIDPEFGLTYVNLTLLQLQTGRYDEALSAARTLNSLWGDLPVVLGLLGQAYAASGQKEEARAILDRLSAQSMDQRVPSFHMAVIHLALGETERSIELLERAVEEQSTGLVICLGVEPLFDPLRSDPRFQELLARVGLPSIGPG